jgi:hypothetical protein
MPGIGDLNSTREALRDLSKVVTSTRQTLATMVRGEDQGYRTHFDHHAESFSSALEHMGEVREGFILSQRSTPQTSLADLRDLVKHILLDWHWVEEMNWLLAPSGHPESLGPQLVFYNHALVALGSVPHLPAEAVTFPQRKPSYEDVSVPTLPHELLTRIEEIEHIIYQSAVKSVRQLEPEPLRRTYAFFEASSWLAKNYLQNIL